MIGLVLVTHGRLAEEFVAAMEHVVGRQEQVRTVAIGPDDDMEERRSEIIASAQEVDSGDGVILLTDMFGGTPSNLAISLLGQSGTIEVIAGTNLPMLIKLASIRGSQPLSEAVAAARDAGQRYINVASHVLAGGAADSSGADEA
mgnify:CR=1 FL=1